MSDDVIKFGEELIRDIKFVSKYGKMDISGVISLINDRIHNGTSAHEEVHFSSNDNNSGYME